MVAILTCYKLKDTRSFLWDSIYRHFIDISYRYILGIGLGVNEIYQQI